MKDLSFDLGDLVVISMRDSVALPESGGPSSCSCSSCVQPQLANQTA